jgi:glucans biosynthesis protein C
LRLFIPFVFGMFIIVVPQAYFQAVSHGELPAGLNLFQIYWLYLKSLPDMQTFHLWFLQDLFVFSIIILPLLITWGKNSESPLSKFAGYFKKPWTALILFVLSIALVNIFIFPDGTWGNRNGGWNIVTYLLFFIFGYFIFANPRIMEMIRKLRWVFLAVGVVALSSALILFFDELAEPTTYFGSPAFAITSILQSLNAWGWLLAILGLGSWFLNRNNKFLAHANEAVLPFYILHQTVIISIGFYIVQWDTGVGLKYLAISVTSFIGIMLIYELVVRQINPLRFLFGMRPNKKQYPMVNSQSPDGQG